MTAQSIAQGLYTTPDGVQIRVRPAVEADLKGMEWDGEYKHFRTLYAQHYANSRSGATLIWVAETEDLQIIGQLFLLLYAQDTDIADGARRAYLFSFRVRPEWRNQGLGSFMLDMAEEELISRGFSSIRLNVARTNPLARRLYERYGYRMIGPDHGVWRYQDENGRWLTVREPAWKMLKNLR